MPLRRPVMVSCDAAALPVPVTSVSMQQANQRLRMAFDGRQGCEPEPKEVEGRTSRAEVEKAQRERETEIERDKSRCWSKAYRGESSITSFNRPTFPARRLGRCYWLCSTGKGDFSSLLFAGRWPAIPVASHLFASRRPQREKESRTGP